MCVTIVKNAIRAIYQAFRESNMEIYVGAFIVIMVGYVLLNAITIFIENFIDNSSFRKKHWNLYKFLSTLEVMICIIFVVFTILILATLAIT
jgi:hypothetical protein